MHPHDEITSPLFRVSVVDHDTEAKSEYGREILFGIDIFLEPKITDEPWVRLQTRNAPRVIYMITLYYSDMRELYPVHGWRYSLDPAIPFGRALFLRQSLDNLARLHRATFTEVPFMKEDMHV